MNIRSKFRYKYKYFYLNIYIYILSSGKICRWYKMNSFISLRIKMEKEANRNRPSEIKTNSWRVEQFICLESVLKIDSWIKKDFRSRIEKASVIWICKSANLKLNLPSSKTLLFEHVIKRRLMQANTYISSKVLKTDIMTKLYRSFTE